MPLSGLLKASVHAPETGEVFIVLLTITHATTPAEITRVSSDPTVRLSDDPVLYGTASRGETFLFFPFDLRLPDAGGEAMPRAQLVIENVGRELIAAIRSVVEPAEILIELVCASTPDTVEASYPVLRVARVQYNAQTITCDLEYAPLTSEPYPAGSFTPGAFPGLFG